MSTTPKTPKYRHELKYQINTAFLPVLRQRLQACMLRDLHADENGGYTGV